MNLPAIVEATLEGLGTLLHIGTTSYDNTKTAEDTLYKPCFWTVRSKGKEYNKEDRKETDAEYITYIEAVQERNVLLTKYAKDKKTEVDITDPLNKDFKMQIGCVREINTDQA